MDFETKYGALGRGFIHVHHLKELAAIKKSYKVNPAKDLRPVCANCHAMLHRRSPALSIEELSELVRLAAKV
jgi:5-methylcytosine-specific restriction enzyme A